MVYNALHRHILGDVQDAALNDWYISVASKLNCTVATTYMCINYTVSWLSNTVDTLAKPRRKYFNFCCLLQRLFLSSPFVFVDALLWKVLAFLPLTYKSVFKQFGIFCHLQ